MKAHLYFLVCTFLFLPFFVNAQLSFLENKGQWDQQVLFRSDNGNNSLFLGKDGYTMLMQDANDYRILSEYYHGHSSETAGDIQNRTTPPIVKLHAYKVKFLHANINSHLIKENALMGYENFFIGNDASKWATGCKSYQAITYKNIYKGIDLVYYVQNNHLKYDLVIYPGADISQIQLQYEGVSSLQLRNEELIVGTSVAEVKELKPYTYQVVNNRKENIVCSYKLNNQVISFEVGNYNREQVLVIDPSIVFSSYSRSASDNWGMTATYGPDGSFFGAGIVQSTGFPVTTGAIQSTGGGPTPSNTPPDIGIIKLSADGTTRIFATYLGGTALEQPHSLIADAAGNLIITGRTSSGVSFPGNLFGTGGGYDIFVTKINADGTAIIGSTKIGGSGDDGVNISPLKSAGPQSILRNFGDDARSEVILNANNNILLASCTRSSNFFITGAFQQTFGGSQDAVIIKLNADATNVIWSTYLGGTGDDATFSLAVKNSNNSIYVTGGTTTTFTFPASTFGVQPTNNGGLTEGYLSLLIDFGNSIGLSRSTYLGTSGADIAYAVKLDQLGFPYVTGTTTGMWPIINAVYSVGNARQFIAKLEPNLSAFIYSTTFGVTGATAPNLTPAAFFVDDCENVYVTGWGGGANTFGTPDFPTAGTAGLIVTANALQTQTDGSDFYIFVLEKNAASHKYGSFFGQNGGNGAYDHVEGGTSRFDRDGVLYLAACANCKALTTELPAVSPFPITAGVYGNINPASGGASCNLGMVKIRFDYAGSNCIVTSDNLIRNNSATALYFFPNPNKGKFYLRYTDPSDAGAKHSIRIYDALGAVVYTQQIAVNPLMSQVMIDMSEHSKGVYLVEVIDAKGKRLATGKFLID